MHRSTGIGVSRWLGGLLGCAPALALPQGCIELLAQAPRVDVVQGQQRDLRLAVPIERLAIGDPKIADVQLLDRRGFLVTGKEQGSTSLLIWTGCSPEPLRSLVEVEGRGSVDTRGAPAFTAGAAEELPNQVQTDIRFVEVSRSKLKQASTSFVRRGGNLWVLGAPGSLGDIKVNADGSGLGGTFGTGSSGFNLIFGGGKWLSFMNALEGSGFAYTLARPSLVAMSGQSASFSPAASFDPGAERHQRQRHHRIQGVWHPPDPHPDGDEQPPHCSQGGAGGQRTGLQRRHPERRVAVPALRVRRTDTSVMLADGELRDQRADQQQLGEQRRQVSLAGRHPDPRCVLPLDQAGQGRPRAADDRHPAPGPAAGRRRTVAGPARRGPAALRSGFSRLYSSAASTTASRTTPVCRIRRRA